MVVFLSITLVIVILILGTSVLNLQEELLNHKVRLEGLNLRMKKLESKYELMTRAEKRGLTEL
jgi:hypothetical protein